MTKTLLIAKHFFLLENTQNLITSLVRSLDFQTFIDECYDLNRTRYGLKSILCRNGDSFLLLSEYLNGFIEEMPSAGENLKDKEIVEDLSRYDGLNRGS